MNGKCLYLASPPLNPFSVQKHVRTYNGQAFTHRHGYDVLRNSTGTLMSSKHQCRRRQAAVHDARQRQPKMNGHFYAFVGANHSRKLYLGL